MSRANAGWILANMLDNEHLIAGTATGVGPSPKIWSSCPVLPIMLDPTKGFVYFNDFLDADTYVAGTLNGGIRLTQTSSKGTLANDPAIPGGVLKISGADAVDKGPIAQFLACQCEPGSGTKIFMEWRILVNAGGGQCFMGLACDSVTDIVPADAVLTNKNLAGFYRDVGTGDTDWTVGVCDASSSEESDDQVAAASESLYEKFGLVFEGIGGVAGSRITFYHNGEPVHVISDEDDLPLLLMCPAFQFHGGDTDTAPSAWLDWLRVAVYNTTNAGRDTDGS
jgi:hypothetical protein